MARSVVVTPLILRARDPFSQVASQCRSLLYNAMADSFDKIAQGARMPQGPRPLPCSKTSHRPRQRQGRLPHRARDGFGIG